MLGGAVGIAPHFTVGKGARLTARSGVMSDVPPGETFGGFPAVPHRRWLRQQVVLDRLTRGDKSVDSPSIGEGQADDAPATAPTRQR